jgi:SAM-dependent methyltransferase
VTSSAAPAGIHPAARVGFDQAADAYERGRPEYPNEAVDWLVRELRIGPGVRALDLAAGTGKLTRSLVPTGASLLAVEPVEGMRRQFRAVLGDVPIAGGRAEAIPFAAGSFGAAVVGQAFHWFDAPVAIDELHRVLEPGGRLGLVWNVRDEENSAFWERLTDLLAPYRGDAPAHRAYVWRRAFEESDLFTPFESRSFPHQQEATRAQVVDRVVSTSFIAALPDHEARRVADRVLRLLDSDEHPAGREPVTLPYRTDVYSCERRD